MVGFNAGCLLLVLDELDAIDTFLFISHDGNSVLCHGLEVDRFDFRSISASNLKVMNTILNHSAEIFFHS